MSEKNDGIVQQSTGMSQETLEKLIEEFGIGLFKIDLVNRSIKLTPNTAKLNGYTPTELPNNEDTKDSLIYEEDRDFVNGSLFSVISGERANYHIEYRMRRRDSSIVWVEETGLISERAPDGRPLSLSAMAMDLSRLKWAEEKTRSAELEVKRISSGAADINLAEENRLLRAANAAAALLIGGFHQDYLVLLNQALHILADSIQAEYACILRNIVIDGEQACFKRAEWSTGAVSSHTDRPETSLYSDILPEWKSVLSEGKNTAASCGGLPQKLLTALKIENAKTIILSPIYLHGEFWGVICFTKNDCAHPFTQTEADIMNSGAMVLASSISRYETFGKITQAREDAVASTQAKGEFLSRMSHEMRTPLNAIIGMSAIAQKEKDHERIMYCLDKVNASSRQLLNIINDVLDMSKIDSGKLEIVKSPFNIYGMIENAVSVSTVSMEQKKQKFTVNIRPEITNLIISDELRLSQVIINLLSNASKFTPVCGNISLSILHKNLTDGGIRLRVEVADSGIGITPQQKDRLFSAFEQADGSTTRQYGGTGLGLAICKRILNLMGGDIWVISKPGQGACFFFELDVALGERYVPSEKEKAHLYAGKPASKKKEKAAEPAQAAAKNSEYDFSGRTVLVAEDVEINREIVAAMLDGTNINIVFAENGRQAVDTVTAGKQHIDLILMDIQMPVMDGWTATKNIRAALPQNRIPIIAMTANAFQEDVDMCLRTGMECHISKPIDMREFLDTLKKYLY